jgi:hypothetical protein
MTTPATTPDDLSLRSVLDSTLKDFGVPAAPSTPAAVEPTPQPNIKQLPFDRRTQALIAIGVLLVIALIGYLWGMRSTPTAAPTPRQTALPTFQPTAAPTVLPTALPAALVSYFDYRDPATIAPITANQITRVIGTAGAWRLVDTGNARVWIAADQVPAGAPVAEPLPDLTPRRPVLAPSAPAPAMQPVAAPTAAPVPCTQDIAPYVVSRRVLAGTLPIGAATGFSCVSAAEAEANAAAHEAEVRASYAKSSEAGR